MLAHWRWVVAICGAAAIGVIAAPVHAGDAKAGQRLAATWCATCHVIGQDGQNAATDSAPTFASIANRQGTTAQSLEAFLADPHKAAMKGIVLPRFEIADLAAYIISLKGADK